MDTTVYTLSYFAVVFLAFLALKAFDKRLAFYFGLLFAVYLALDGLATKLPYIAQFFNFNPGDWNWAGKVYSVLFAVAVTLCLGMSAKAIGLVLPQRHIKAGIIALIPLTFVGVVLGHVFNHSAPSAEMFAFQALMPSLAEELAFRGVAPALGSSGFPVNNIVDCVHQAAG